MNDIKFLNNNTTPYLGFILAILSIIPVLLTLTIFRPKYNDKENKKISKKDKILLCINGVLYIINMIILCTSKNIFDIKNANLWFGIMCFFYVIYYELYIRYVLRGRKYNLLYESFIYIKIPIFISMSMSIVFAGIWSKSILLIITSTIFTITNCYTAYNRYLKILKSNNLKYMSNKNK